MQLTNEKFGNSIQAKKHNVKNKNKRTIAEVNEESVKLEPVELEAEETKENVPGAVFDTESSLVDDILLVESGGLTSRSHETSDSGGQQHKEGWAISGGNEGIVEHFHKLVPDMALEFPFELDKFQKEILIVAKFTLPYVCTMTISTSSSFPSFSPSQQPTQNPPPPLPPAIERPKKPKHHTLRVNQHHHQHHVGPLHALKGTGFLSAIGQAIEEEEYRKARAEVNRKGFNLEGYSIEGVSIGGHETCVIVPELKSAFDIGRCPSRAVNQNFVFITHAHLDHIGGLPMYVATRGLYNLKPPTVFVPPCLKEDVEKLFDIHRTMSQVELNLDLVTLDVGETYEMRNNLVVRPFKTHHVIPSQGYVIYSVRKKLRKQYMHLNGKQIEKLKKSGVEITDTILSPEVAFTGDTMSDFFLDPRSADALRAKILITEGYVIYSVRKKLRKQYMHLNGKQIEKLKKSGVEITDTILSPEVAFTGDTMSDFFLDPRSADALRAKILITEATFLDEGCSIEHAREHGHTHLFEIIEHAQWIRNKAVLLTHFSPRYNIEDIRLAVSKLQLKVSAKVVALTEGFKSTYS
ncbi:hypothetical protein TEA_008512 [Camellia sinensis var. sinensis]|uniref:Uncharacterized protein n=1 Tax=Camellia sinensis var. sinensis TaxID=542762 RepID=A0A4S4EY77_CAMSN|nr:hypothetical protein TEA_008512 [Camellia sinensis var. sinensis]